MWPSLPWKMPWWNARREEQKGEYFVAEMHIQMKQSHKNEIIISYLSNLESVCKGIFKCKWSVKRRKIFIMKDWVLPSILMILSALFFNIFAFFIMSVSILGIFLFPLRCISLKLINQFWMKWQNILFWYTLHTSYEAKYKSVDISIRCHLSPL